MTNNKLHKFIISHGASGSCWLDRVFDECRTEIDHNITNFTSGCGAHVKSPAAVKIRYGSNFKVLYPIRHPVETLMSYARRGFFISSEHCLNMGGDICKWEEFKRRFNISHKTEPEEILRNLLKVEYKIFDIKGHYSAWNSEEVNVMFISYEKIVSDWRHICTYFQAEYQIENIKDWKRSNCSRFDLPEQVLGGLSEKYSEEIEFYNFVRGV
jgi:hypothetical protein